MESGFFALLARGRYIRRWGLMRSTNEENISEHSYMTALLAHALGSLNLGLVDTLEDVIYDQRLRLAMPHTLDDRVVIIDIDEPSLSRIGPSLRHSSSIPAAASSHAFARPTM